ncbi:hypothetical protein M3Y99_01777600 [Aphelenchoides fujianensis]|nr:hypothetical protein M3Y99_01777600 [Aphelenchoides fujianensis]
MSSITPNSSIIHDEQTPPVPTTPINSKMASAENGRRVHFSEKTDPTQTPESNDACNSSMEDGEEQSETTKAARSLVGENGKPAPCTPAYNRVRKTLLEFHVQSPSDVNLSPISKCLAGDRQRNSKFKHPHNLPMERKLDLSRKLDDQ